LKGCLVAVGTNQTFATASELQEAMKRIKQLDGVLGRNTMENEILKFCPYYVCQLKLKLELKSYAAKVKYVNPSYPLFASQRATRMA
jgi:hypothetical protein